MTLAQIDEVISCFTRAAMLAWRVGFHGVEVHAARIATPAYPQLPNIRLTYMQMGFFCLNLCLDRPTPAQMTSEALLKGASKLCFTFSARRASGILLCRC